MGSWRRGGLSLISIGFRRLANFPCEYIGEVAVVAKAAVVGNLGNGVILMIPQLEAGPVKPIFSHIFQRGDVEQLLELPLERASGKMRFGSQFIDGDPLGIGVVDEIHDLFELVIMSWHRTGIAAVAQSSCKADDLTLMIKQRNFSAKIP